MILIDFSSFIYSNVYVHALKKIKVDEDFLRHLVLNSIRANKQKFASTYGELVICCDSRGDYWRRSVFPYYKANRKEEREKNAPIVNWPEIFKAKDTIEQELREYFPYRVVRAARAECDDVIATIVDLHTEQSLFGGKKLKQGIDPILILARDKDFVQLHCAGVVQYDPIGKKFVGSSNTQQYLFEHIVKGERGDGIPNIRSPDDSYVNKIRQSPITKKFINELKDIENSDHPLNRNWMRNKQLIDFNEIPQSIKNSIKKEFEHSTPEHGKEKLFDYFMSKRLRLLMESISQF